MLKRLVLVLLLGTLAYAAGTLDKEARATSVTLGGLLKPAQAAHPECATDHKATKCRTLARAITSQNMLVYALASYCGWPTDKPLPNVGTMCAIVPKEAPALKSALANANQVISQVKRLQ